MRELILRIVRRSLFVAIVLGAIGYAFAEAYFIVQRMYGGVPNPADESGKWQAPLRMAGFGVAFLTVMEVLFYFVRKKRPPVPASLDESPIIPPSPTVAPSMWINKEKPADNSSDDPLSSSSKPEAPS